MKDRTLISFDYAVKYILRSKADMTILSGFLTELLGRKVRVTGLCESESNKYDPTKKTGRVDVKAKIDDGEIAIFEFQFLEGIDFFDRVLFGVSKAITEQVDSGSKYKIKKVYSIDVAYYDVGAKKEYLFKGGFSGFRGVNFKNETIPFIGNLKRDIQPEYYLILPEMFDEQMRSRFDEWIYILKNSKAPEKYTASGIKEAKARLDYLNMTPEERKKYDEYTDGKLSIDSALETAIKKGEKKGITKEKMRTVKKLLTENMDINKISEITEIPVDRIKKIKIMKK